MWVLFALSGPVLWAASTHIDKYLVEKYFKGSGTAVLMVFTALIGLLALPLIWAFHPGALALPLTAILVLIASGIMYMGSMLFYLRAIQSEEASVVSPMFQATTVWSYALGYFFLKESLAPLQLFGGALIVAASLMLSLDSGFRFHRMKLRLVVSMLACTLALALSAGVFKFFAIQDDFWITTFWTFVGHALFGGVLLAIPGNWAKIRDLLARNPGAVLAINASNELINLGGGLGVRYALLLAPLALVQAVSGTTALFVFLFGIVLTRFFPAIGREDLSHKNLLQKGFAALLVTVGIACMNSAPFETGIAKAESAPVATEEEIVPAKPELDRADYDRRMKELANIPPAPPAPVCTPTPEKPCLPVVPPPAPLWPVKAAYPNVGAILPFHRLIAYYGNFYAKGMGVLGEYPEDVMLAKFRAEIKKWNEADPGTPVMPVVDYIAITAQASAGKDGMYRARMPLDQIDKALGVAEKLNGIVIVEVQPGLSKLMDEIKWLGPKLIHPKVHLAIDPEFSMKDGSRPGKRVGTVDATDINAAAQYLAELVREHDLPPKVIVVHRYTRAMVTNATKITPLPEVQIIMDMDGWGPPAKKYSTYNAYIKPEPVQFTGFKLFYKNDIWQPGTTLLGPTELLKLSPRPSFVQFQ